MAKEKRSEHKRPIEAYQHRGKQRSNNPPVGLVTPETDPDVGKKKAYSYDPHLDPQLIWASKAEHTSFEVPTVSLHVHERIDPQTIIEAVRKRNGDGGGQLPLFAQPEENPPLRQAVEFYQHAHGWSNRLIAGDSLLVMNSLLEKEGMAGKAQMIYFDPPYGITYGSNFQPFVNKTDVKDGKDEDLTSEPEQIRAFRDTWELGIHSYLAYLRDRLLLARELLAESGSIFLQINDDNVHHVREIADEVFGTGNFLVSIVVKKKSVTTVTDPINDYLLWYGRNADVVKKKVRKLSLPKSPFDEDARFKYAEFPDGSRKRLEDCIPDELKDERVRFMNDDYPLVSQDWSEGRSGPFVFEGRKLLPGKGRHWTYDPETGMKRLAIAGRIRAAENTARGIVYFDDFGRGPIPNIWEFHGERDAIYVVQTNRGVIERCLLMTTDAGDLVIDSTCGSGSTAYVAEKWGRRWITCDTSRVALALARQRLMTADFDYYELAHPQEGVGSGFNCRTVRNITLKSIANNPDIHDGMTAKEIRDAIARDADQVTLYDDPVKDRKRVRVSGPFTVEAVPAPAVQSVEEVLKGVPPASDLSISRSGETLRQGEWRDELFRTGIRGKAGQQIQFVRLEPLPGCRWLHADGETAYGSNNRKKTNTSNPVRVVVSFGPEHAPMEQRQVAQAIEEAQTLVPKPKVIVFAAFQFDPEAAKDVDETNWPGVALLRAQMNADLLTEDLKKKHASNESFWLIGQPDVRVQRVAKGAEKGKWQVSVEGFDYYNTVTGELESGGSERIAMWMLDTDYDGRSLYPRQVFFPMAGENEGWAKLARNLKAEIDEELLEAYRGTESLPFEAGEHKRIAVKIVDDRGIESLKVLELN